MIGKNAPLRRYRDELASTRVVCLYIPDDYDHADEALIDRLRGGVVYWAP